MMVSDQIAVLVFFLSIFSLGITVPLAIWIGDAMRRPYCVPCAFGPPIVVMVLCLLELAI